MPKPPALKGSLQGGQQLGSLCLSQLSAGSWLTLREEGWPRIAIVRPSQQLPDTPTHCERGQNRVILQNHCRRKGGTWRKKNRPSAKEVRTPSNFTDCNEDRGRACYEKGRGVAGRKALCRAAEDSREPHTGMEDQDTGQTSHLLQAGC